MKHFDDDKNPCSAHTQTHTGFCANIISILNFQMVIHHTMSSGNHLIGHRFFLQQDESELFSLTIWAGQILLLLFGPVVQFCSIFIHFLVTEQHKTTSILFFFYWRKITPNFCSILCTIQQSEWVSCVYFLHLQFHHSIAAPNNKKAKLKEIQDVKNMNHGVKKQRCFRRAVLFWFCRINILCCYYGNHGGRHKKRKLNT